MMVSVRSAPLLVILLDARVLVVNVQRTENAVSAGYAVRRGKWASNSSHRASDWLFLRRRHHALGDHPGAIARRRALADPAIEDQLHLVGSIPCTRTPNRYPAAAPKRSPRVAVAPWARHPGKLSTRHGQTRRRAVSGLESRSGHELSKTWPQRASALIGKGDERRR